jgi:hypothetical protein
MCYAHSDRELARTVAERLETLGVRLWMDVRDLQGGANWDNEIIAAIGRADFSLVLATPASAASEFVQREIDLILQTRKPVFPVAVDIGSALKGPAFKRLADRHFLQITQGSGWLEQLTEAIASLQREGGAGNLERTLLERSGGNIGRLVAMVHWIRQQPDGTAGMARMPPTLYGDPDEVWESTIRDLGEEAGDLLGVLAMAKAPIALSPIQPLAAEGRSWQDLAIPLSQVSNLVVQAPTPADAERRYAVSDESVRQGVLKQLTPEGRRNISEILSRLTDEEYALRYRLGHLVDAGLIGPAIDVAGDVELLTRICVALGVDDLEAQLSAVVTAARESDVPPMQAEAAAT